MQFTRLLRHAASSPLRAILDNEELRRRIEFEIKQNYFNELNIEVPIGFGLKAPVVSPESWISLEEIFFQREYESALENISSEKHCPERWLDLGCHSGYFSLWLLYERARAGLAINTSKALLLDPDPRISLAVKTLIATNRLEGNFQFVPKAISKSSEKIPFAKRGYMSSSLAELGEKSEDICLVDPISAKEITALMSPPYDLLKIDIEGGEYDLFTSYQEILKASRHIILEWHSWHTGGGGSQQLRQLAQQLGFRIMSESASPRVVTINGKSEQCGLFVLENS